MGSRVTGHLPNKATISAMRIFQWENIFSLKSLAYLWKTVYPTSAVGLMRNPCIYQVPSFGVFGVIFFVFLAQCHGALGILWDSQVFLITPSVYPLKQLTQDVINATRRFGGLVNHAFFRKGQCSSKRGQILTLINKILAKNVLICFLICQGRGNGLLSSLQKF